MFYELYTDAWFDPEDLEFVEVIDMTGAGAEGVTIVQTGGAYITEERLRKALESAGHFTLEKPPSPPKGRKHWFPGGWKPPAQPGHLFWTPPPSIGPTIMDAWAQWEEFSKEGGKFKDFPEPLRNAVLVGASDVLGYYGSDGGHEEVVIERGPGAAAKKRKWGEGAIVTSNPERAITRILRKMGVQDA